MNKKDQKQIEKIYMSLYENVQPENESRIISDLIYFFKDLPEWVSRSFINIIQENGVQNIQDTYEYLDNITKKFGILNNKQDPIREQTLNACLQAKKYISNLNIF